MPLPQEPRHTLRLGWNDLDPIPFSVTDILESVRDIVQPIAEEKGLTVRLATPEADFRVGHPVALSRVLLNLTTNALKFTAEGFVEVTARQLSAGTVEFSVRDTGRGIPPQSMATLYEPFRRRQKPGEYAFSGSGLGLSICRKLVEAMGSTLDVETGSGEGTRFFFRSRSPSCRPAAVRLSDRLRPTDPTRRWPCRYSFPPSEPGLGGLAGGDNATTLMTSGSRSVRVADVPDPDRSGSGSAGWAPGA